MIANSSHMLYHRQLPKVSYPYKSRNSTFVFVSVAKKVLFDLLVVGFQQEQALGGTPGRCHTRVKIGVPRPCAEERIALTGRVGKPIDTFTQILQVDECNLLECIVRHDLAKTRTGRIRRLYSIDIK